MKPVEFEHQNIVFAKDQPEYQPLPALRIDSPEGEVISCWKMSFKERMKVLFFGRVSARRFGEHLFAAVFKQEEDLFLFSSFVFVCLGCCFIMTRQNQIDLFNSYIV